LGKHGNKKGGGGGGSPEEEMGLPTAPLWMVTFGDMSGLLMAFFVMMLAFSSVEKESFKEAIASIQQAIGILPYGQSVIKFDQVPAVRLSPVPPAKEIMDRIRRATSQAGLSGGVSVMLSKEGIRITIQSPILFDSGSGQLRPDALPILDELVRILGESPNMVVVEGHTDNIPIHTAAFESNWELSTARAISVAKYMFQKVNLNPERFTVAGYAEYHPTTANDTPEGRQLNRRVEILLKNIETPESQSVKEEGT
jgi:chemotaxis protein MotB